jgi:hypothetical protein
MQMFRGFSAHIMEAVNRLGIEGLTLPTIPEDDRSILHFFSQLAEKLAEASAKVSELVDAECRELQGLAGTRIFSNIQRLSPDLDLEEVLQRRAPPPPGTPDRATQARAERLDIALQRLQALQRRRHKLWKVWQRRSQGSRRRQSNGVQRRGVLGVQPRHQ